MSTDTAKMLLKELLARVAEPDSPEERDAAWDEIVARLDAAEETQRLADHDIALRDRRIEKLKEALRGLRYHKTDCWCLLGDGQHDVACRAVQAVLAEQEKGAEMSDDFHELATEQFNRAQVLQARLDRALVEGIPDPELLRVTRALYVKLAQTHPGDLAAEEGWLDEWNDVRRVLAERERESLLAEQEKPEEK